MGLNLKGYAATPRLAAVRAAYRKYKKLGAGPQPADQRITALVLLGTGIGNIIEQTSLVRAVSTMYRTVDVFVPLSPQATAEVIKGMPEIRRLYVYKEGYSKLLAKRAQYSAIFATYLTCDFASRFNSQAVYVSGNMIKADVSEKELCLSAAIDAGYLGAMPDAWCRYEPWPHVMNTPLIGISGGSRGEKQWRLKRYPHYLDVVNYVLEKRPDVHFVNIGTLNDDEISHSNVLDLRGLTTIGQSAAIASQCGVYLANDCGMAHVAAAVGTPTIVVFGPTRIIKNLPASNAICVTREDLKCRPCQYKRQSLGRLPQSGKPCKHECMKNLKASVVGDILLQALHDAYV